MNRLRALAMMAGVLATMSVAGVARAQVDVSGKGGPVQINGDNWRADQTIHTEYWDGNVEVQQDDARLRADHIKLIHTTAPNGDQKSWGDVIRMEASGNVYYVAEDRTMTGDNAVYTKGDDTVVVTGEKVVLKQGDNVMTGTRVVSHPDAGTSTIDSAPDSSNHGRVVAVIYPNQKNGSDATAKKPAAGTPVKPGAAPAKSGSGKSTSNKAAAASAGSSASQ